MTQHPAPVLDDSLHSVVAATLVQQDLLPPGRPLTLVVGVSGGPDSVCLLHILHALAPTLDLKIHIAHVNHGLRPGSDEDARFTAALADALKLPYHILTLDPEELRTGASGLEASARLARYAALCATARNVAEPGQVPCLAVAHHANDQAETVLLRLIQGTGLAGLGAMRSGVEVRYGAAAGETAPVRLIRPMLAILREDVMAYLARHQLAWRLDESNADLHHLRNRLRLELLPFLQEINPGIVTTLCQTAELLSGDAARIEQLDAGALASLLTEPVTADRVVIDLERWRSLPEADRRGVLRTALGRLARDGREIGFEQILRLTRAAGDATHASGPHPLPCDLAWTIAGAPLRLCLHRTQTLPVSVTHPWLDPNWRSTESPVILPVPGAVPVGSWILRISLIPRSEWVAPLDLGRAAWQLVGDADRLGVLRLTVPKPGMQIAPMGMAGRHKQVGDLFTDTKIPPAVRIGWPLIVDDSSGRVLWVCGIRAAEDARVTASTQRVAWLRWEPIADVES